MSLSASSKSFEFVSVGVRVCPELPRGSTLRSMFLPVYSSVAHLWAGSFAIEFLSPDLCEEKRVGASKLECYDSINMVKNSQGCQVLVIGHLQGFCSQKL